MWARGLNTRRAKFSVERASVFSFEGIAKGEPIKETRIEEHILTNNTAS